MGNLTQRCLHHQSLKLNCLQQICEINKISIYKIEVGVLGFWGFGVLGFWVVRFMSQDYV